MSCKRVEGPCGHLRDLGSNVMNKASELINGERRQQYGDPEGSFTRLGEMWSATLDLPTNIPPHLVALMMAQLKICRATESHNHEDSYVDAIGYIALASEVAK